MFPVPMPNEKSFFPAAEAFHMPARARVCVMCVAICTQFEMGEEWTLDTPQAERHENERRR